MSTKFIKNVFMYSTSLGYRHCSMWISVQCMFMFTTTKMTQNKYNSTNVGRSNHHYNHHYSNFSDLGHTTFLTFFFNVRFLHLCAKFYTVETLVALKALPMLQAWYRYTGTVDTVFIFINGKPPKIKFTHENRDRLIGANCPDMSGTLTIFKVLSRV